MPHMVVFRTKEGKQGYHLADTLDDAVRFVEHLRNNEQVDDSKVYRMHEVPIEFKVMYKVEVAGPSGAAPSQSDDNAGGGTPRSTESASPRSTESASPRSTESASPRSTESGSASSGPSRGEDRNDSVRAQSNGGVTAAAAPGPVAETGGRFGLFSRA